MFLPWQVAKREYESIHAEQFLQTWRRNFLLIHKRMQKKSSAHNSFLRYDSKSVLPSIVCYFLLHPVPQLCNSSARPLKLDRSVKFFSVYNFSCSFIQILLLAFFTQYLSLFNLHTIYANISHLNSGTVLLAAHFKDSILNQSK